MRRDVVWQDTETKGATTLTAKIKTIVHLYILSQYRHHHQTSGLSFCLVLHEHAIKSVWRVLSMSESPYCMYVLQCCTEPWRDEVRYGAPYSLAADTRHDHHPARSYAKIYYTIFPFPVASPYQIRYKSVTSWRRRKSVVSCRFSNSITTTCCGLVSDTANYLDMSR